MNNKRNTNILTGVRTSVGHQVERLKLNRDQLLANFASGSQNQVAFWAIGSDTALTLSGSNALNYEDGAGLTLSGALDVTGSVVIGTRDFVYDINAQILTMSGSAQDLPRIIFNNTNQVSNSRPGISFEDNGTFRGGLFFRHDTDAMEIWSNGTGNLTLTSSIGTPAVGINTSIVPHAGVGFAKLAIDGTDGAGSGPHIQITTVADNYPLLQVLAWTHDNISLNFDSFYDGAWTSADAGSNFQIYKTTDQLQINYDSGVAADSTLTWVNGFTLDTAGTVTIPGPYLAAPSYIARNVNNDALIINGGNVVNAGANIELYGGTHASFANNAYYDATVHTFRNQGSNVTYMVVDGNGDVGIGSTSPGDRLYVYDDAASQYVALFHNDGNHANRYGIRVAAGLDTPAANGDILWFVLADGNGTDVSWIRYITTSPYVQFSAASDARFKKNIRPTSTTALDKIKALEVVDFEWTGKFEDRAPQKMWFTAQQVETVIPEAVGPPVTDSDGDDVLVLGTSTFVPYLIKAMQEQQDIIDSLEQRIATLENQ